MRRGMFLQNVDKYNLIIGGVSATISTPTLLATKISCTVTDITDFLIVGSDIYARIVNGPFAVIFNAFQNNTSITSFTSKNGIINSLAAGGCFDGCTNMTYFEIQASSLDFGNVAASLSQLEDCTSLSPVNIKIPAIVTNSRWNNTFRRGLDNGTVLDLSKTTSINHTSQPSNNTFQNFNTITVDLRNCTTINVVFTNTTSGMFNDFNGTVRLWSLTSLQTNPASVTGVFEQSSTTIRIEVNVALKTANSGSPHAELINAISKGATVVYTDTSGNIIP